MSPIYKASRHIAAALNSEDRHRPLHTQAAALKLDLNDFNMCLSMSSITRTLNFLKRLSTQRLSTQLNTQARSTLKIGTEHSGSQHSSTHRQRLSTQRLSTLKIGTGLSTHRQRLSTQRLSTQLNTQARSTLKIGTEHSGSQHSSTHRQRPIISI